MLWIQIILEGVYVHTKLTTAARQEFPSKTESCNSNRSTTSPKRWIIVVQAVDKEAVARSHN